ncbi:MAG: DinB family protein [Tepidisphaeraceae bacterium]|jgi:hypothetical protein
MPYNELLVQSLRNGLGLLKMTIQDMSDAELIQRPVPAANNALWQIGQTISAEAWMVNSCAGKTIIELPAGFDARYTKETSKIDDPAKLGNKADLMALFDKVRAKTADWVATLSADDLAKPAPEMLRKMCPTVGAVVFLFGDHVAMHVGQIQVLRRKLGKPILF